jgi:lipopolysaccharide transport system ATP-binding protein
MSNTAILIEGLSKRYRIGNKESYRTLRESINAAALKPIQIVRSLISRNGRQTVDEDIWALKDVSFEVKQGEVIGIIGRNGAGKSTLLKILSRITEPTEGEAAIHGRVSSLLEVGTGFHPELTGRENIFLNGAILGMSRAEIVRKFDEMVEFSGVEKFIDTPVKRYSSGMYLRLAFAVAAHLEPEILLVDEVLAVGDAAFQKKCLDKMDDVAKQGRTVLFVSHNLQAITRLCTRAVLLDGGQVAKTGSPSEVVSAYVESESATKLTGLESELASDEIRLKQITVTQDGFEVPEFLDNGKPFEVRIKYDLLSPVNNLLLGFDALTSDGTVMFRTYDMLAAGMGRREPGSYESVCQFPGNFFKSRPYHLHLLVGMHRQKGWLSKDKISLRIEFDSPRTWDVTFEGFLLPIGEWSVNEDI